MRLLAVSFLGVLAAVGCSDRPLEETATETPTQETTTGQPASTSQPQPTTGPAELTITGTETTASPATSEGTTGMDSLDPDTGDSGAPCDGWLMPVQDCPEGQKCTVGGSLSEMHCVDVAPAPKGLYEPCQVLPGEGFSGLDDCGPGLLCWAMDETGVGQCLGFCHGPANSPSCEDPAAKCWQCAECATGICWPSCDPLQQDCVDGQMCLPDPEDESKFICVVDASGAGGQAFDPCEFVNQCDPGLLCVESALAAECDQGSPRCCLPMCDTSAPMCPGAGQVCQPWFEEGQAPPSLENVGLCGLP
jgi:hypothetical protein